MKLTSSQASTSPSSTACSCWACTSPAGAAAVAAALVAVLRLSVLLLRPATGDRGSASREVAQTGTLCGWEILVKQQESDSQATRHRHKSCLAEMAFLCKLCARLA